MIIGYKNNYFFTILASLALAGIVGHTFVAASAVQEIKSKQDFAELVNSKKNIIAQFYNRSCPICQKFEASGIFQKAAADNPSITFVKIEKDLNNLHRSYGIQFYPTFIFFKDGERKSQSTGAFSADRLNDEIKKQFL